MRQKNLIATLIVLFASAGLYGQNSVAATSVAAEVPSKTSSSNASYYIDPLPLHLNLILPPPPARDSATTAAELKELHRIEAERTPAQIRLTIMKKTSSSSRPSWVQALPLRLYLSRPHCQPVCGKKKVPQAVRSKRSITVHVPIRLTAHFTQFAHSTPSPRRTRAGIRFPAIYLPLRLCN